MSARLSLPRRSPADVVRGLHRSVAAHDVEGIVAHFARDYALEDPIRPDRSFRGVDQVRRNWSGILAAMPDLEIEERGLVADGPTVWTEIVMRGHRTDGSEQIMRGVMIFQVADGLIVAGTFYLAPVVHDGRDADAAVRTIISPPRP
jgi:ketosteroid isomerase-like protein